jgi:hypothetical protein
VESYNVGSSPSLLALQPCVGLSLFPGFITVNFSGGGVVGETHAQPLTCRSRDYTSSGAYPLTCLAWVALPGAYAPASIAFRVTRARKPRLYGKAGVFEDEY